MVAGILEMTISDQHHRILGTPQYTAPEYFLGENGSPRADLFSLGVIAYQMLSGKFPYGTQVAKSTTKAAQRQLRYHSLRDYCPEVPRWVDAAIRKAVHPNPLKRYDDAAEFIYDLHHPNKAFLSQARVPLIERHPVTFWKCTSAILLLIIVLLLGFRR